MSRRRRRRRQRQAHFKSQVSSTGTSSLFRLDFFSLFFLRKNKDSFAEFRRLGTASSVGCVWPQRVVPCLGGKVGLADSPVPLRRLIALVRFLSLILAPNRSRNPPCALPATGWALITTPQRHLHEHLSNTSWHPTATFQSIPALPTIPTNYVLLGCRHGHAHGISQHGHEPILLSRHEHQPFS